MYHSIHAQTPISDARERLAGVIETPFAAAVSWDPSKPSCGRHRGSGRLRLFDEAEGAVDWAELRARQENGYRWPIASIGQVGPVAAASR